MPSHPPLPRSLSHHFRLAAAILLFAFPSDGATWTVDVAADSLALGCNDLVVGDCSLRGAVQKANQSPGLDTIVFGFGITQIDLTIVGADEDDNQTGDIDVADDLTVDGGGVVTIDGSLLGDRAFDLVASPEDYVVALKDLRIAGAGAAPHGRGGEDLDGGAIRCTGAELLALFGVTLEGNGAAGRGGGLYVGGCDAVLQASTIEANTAIYGGGVSFWGNGTLTAPLSAVVGNHATNSGGGLDIGPTGPSVSLDNMTLSGNTAASHGSAILNWSPNLELDFVTIVAPSGVSAIAQINAGSVLQVGNSLVVGSCDSPAGPVLSLGGNLESPGDTCSLLPGTDLVNVGDARLLPLAVEGDSTPFHRPLPDSPAIDDPLGSITGCPANDQRFGPPRPLDGDHDGLAACDIGAIEGDLVFLDGFESGDTSQWN